MGEEGGRSRVDTVPLGQGLGKIRSRVQLRRVSAFSIFVAFCWGLTPSVV